MAEKDDNGEKLDLRSLKEALSNLPKATQDAVIKGIKEVMTEEREIRAAQSRQIEYDDDGDDDSDDDADLERLDRKGFAQHLERKFSKALEKSLKPLVDRLEETDGQMQRNQLIAAFQKVKSEHKDFDDWKEDIGKIAKRNPTLSPEEMYILARAQNPDKAKELDNKYKTAEQETTAKTKVPFGGLTPTSGKGSNEKDSGKLDAKSASEKAWETVMSAVPEELLGESA